MGIRALPGVQFGQGIVSPNQPAGAAASAGGDAGAVAGAVVVDLAAGGNNVLYTVREGKKFSPKGCQLLNETITVAAAGATIRYYMDATPITGEIVLSNLPVVDQSEDDREFADEGAYGVGAQLILTVVTPATHGTHTARALAKGDEYDA